ncbi:MAG: hypothetical protein IPL31_04705 [Saprospiraceae bacterium]|nr:hypothetical protein [Saprospiraceae bacterium]
MSHDSSSTLPGQIKSQSSISGYLSSNVEMISDPFIGRFIGEINGLQFVLEIRKSTSGNYEIYVNEQGPDIANKSKDVLIGTADGFDFTISLSGSNIVLSMFDQSSVFVREGKVQDNQTNSPSNEVIENLKKSDKIIENKIDPLIGTFSGYGENNIAIKVIISKNAEQEYLLTFNGIGPNRAEKSGGILLLSESGVTFSFEADANGLIFKGNGKSIRLNRDGVNPKVTTAPKNTSPVKFEGTYNAYRNGKAFGMGRVTIKAAGDNSYKLSDDKEQLKCEKEGNQMVGMLDDANKSVVSVRIQNNGLILCISGTDIELTNATPVYSDQSSRQIDQRIIGKWNGSKTYNSGYGGGSSIHEKIYLFRANGTYEFKSSSAMSGRGWSSVNDGDLIKGGYFILWITDSKNIINIGGTQLVYELFNNNQSMKLDGIIYEKM